MKKILVIGDACTDIYIYGKCDRLCPESPVPVFIPVEEKSMGGMALNLFNNAQSISSKVEIKCNKNYSNITKIRYIDILTNHMFLRVDNDVKYDRINVYDIDFKEYEAIIVSDYNKGCLTENDIKFILKNHKSVFIDTKKKINNWVNGVLFLKINKKEYENSKTYIDKNLLDKTIITLGEDGCMLNNKKFETKRVEIRDLSGAGDTFMAALVINFLSTKNINESMQFANECASKVVQKKGTSII